MTFASWVSREAILASSAPGAGAVAIVLRIASDERDTAVWASRIIAARSHFRAGVEVGKCLTEKSAL